MRNLTLRLLAVTAIQHYAVAQDPTVANGKDAKALSLPDLSAVAAIFPKGKDWNSPILNITVPPGPYKVAVTGSPAFPDRTIYYPLNTGEKTIPILAWSNGMCYRYGLMYYEFLNELASHGYFIVAPGEPTKVAFPATNKAYQATSIEMAKKWKTSAPFNMDTSRIAVGGTSCGGLESIANLAADKKKELTTGILFNTGGLAEPAALDFKVPTMWIGGGPMDVAFKATQSNYAWLKKNKPELPTWKGDFETGHLGSFQTPRGGMYAETALHWLNWLLKDQTEERKFFVGGNEGPAGKRGWRIQSQGF